MKEIKLEMCLSAHECPPLAAKESEGSFDEGDWVI